MCYSTEWVEHWDKESVEEYMDVLTTATVLEQIHSDFAGMSKINYCIAGKFRGEKVWQIYSF